MANEYSAVTCYERFGTAREEYDDERGLMSASVQLFCAYASRHALASDIISNYRAWPKGSATLVPQAYGASIEPWDDAGVSYGSGSQRIDPGTALVTIKYSTKRVELITEELEPVVEAIKDDPHLFTWDDAQSLINEFGDEVKDDNGDVVFGEPSLLNLDTPVVWMRRSLNIVRTELFVNPPLPDALFDFVGGCNNAPFTSGLLGKTFDTETLVYNPPVLRLKYNSIGDRQFDVTKRFNYVPWGANNFWRNDVGAYSRMVYRGTNTPRVTFPPVDFSQIMSPQQPY